MWRLCPLALALFCAHAAAEPLLLQATLGTLESPDRICPKAFASRCSGLRQASRSPKMRAQTEGREGDAAELDFVYLGPTEEVAPLASGERRRQLGLKLRARDGCNVLYVMWRIEPEPDLVVSRKANPGMERHAECGTRGYRRLRPATYTPPPPLVVGARHRLRARVEEKRLRVWIDGALVWEGELDEAAARMRGPVGVRSDNVAFAFTLGTP